MSNARSYRMRLFFILCATLIISSCATSEQARSDQQNSTANESLTTLNRAVPNSIADEVPPFYYDAIENGTRTVDGAPGPRYWQQKSDYQIDVEILPEQKKLQATARIIYHNNSPDTLRQLFLELAQNVHKAGSPRTDQTEITGGVTIQDFAYNGADLRPITRRGQSGYVVDGTVMAVVPGNALLPGESVTMETSWNFTIPRQGAGGRMGYNEDNLFHIAYWFPKVRVYDDVIGWFTDPFLANAEFYHEFGDFDVTVTAPAHWVVAATGQLENAEKVLQQPIYERLQKAYASDNIHTVVDEDDFGNVTAVDQGEKVQWHFSAEWVNDFSFSLTKESIWDATRTPVGDVDGDGTDDYSHINALYRPSAPLWSESARYAQHSIKFLSTFTGLSYPWPHMTAVEGGGITGGGMEFPMVTLIGDYIGRSPEDLYAVTAHELAHMWIPMQLATNERWYAWIDEGFTTFNENQAKKDFYPDMDNPDITDFNGYTQITGTGREGEIMRRSDYHYNGSAYGVASYPKPASILVTLRNMLGEATFIEAYHTFMERWQFKHPYPWDLFNTFEDIAGRDLDWFWRSWYYETWTLDQSIAEVSQGDSGTEILIQDLGQIPMPADVRITLSNGEVINRTIDVETWLQGATSTIIRVDTDARTVKVALDPEHKYPDVNRRNNVWED